ncbi:hypothetical protein KCP91_02815 [Microvirga sp. SRT01]|uniref:Flagellar hook-length control protein FliK n=1 Tax=Sphingomonas longa TaxID=2778730 RepID=A0ABS2D2Y4_9SPHN|nr:MULTISPECIES: hypothetical protein [Alphaproteobacteria]MBM6575288.1 hypothetical protein [Sphingomonas sp. BT552]MBR7708338.1 hypothetical protein [Microvirga sp. SRT01]
MTSIDSSRSASQPQRTSRTASPHQPQQQPADAKAMGEALASARRQMPPVPARPGGMPQRAPTSAATAAQRDGTAGEMAAALSAARGRDGDAALADRFRLDREGGDGSAGFGQAQTAAPPAPLPMPQMPSAMIDPSGFAQMLADLWTRENGKGHKEVQVRFGDSAWPATGARLVRNAAGTLDVALLVDSAATGFGDRLPGLERHLADAGVAVGSLAMEADG